MENGYLSGLLRPPPPNGGPPLIPPPSWGLRGPGLIPYHPSHHPPPLPPSAPFHPLCPSSSSHPSSSISNGQRHSSRPPFEPRPSFYHHPQHHHHPSSSAKSEFKPFLLSPPSSSAPCNPPATSNLLYSNYGGFGFLGHPLPPREGGSLFSPPNVAPNSSSASSSFHSVAAAAGSAPPRSEESFTQALLNLSKVAAPPRNSLASSTCVTSVSSSQVLQQRETGSAFSAPCKTNAASSCSPSYKEVSLISVSDEEVLVDDFDGQCCRTYPLNHSRILKWREERAKAVVVKTSAKEAPPTTSTPAPLASNSNSAIPVGIAIGRQRTLHEKPSPSEASKRSGGNAPPSHLDPVSDRPSSLLHPLGSGLPPPPPWGPGNPPPGAWPHDSLPFSHPPHPSSPWPNHPHMGPIPMGYQLAKDPLTGQILLIPTDGGGPSRPNPLWGGPGFEGPPSLSPSYPPHYPHHPHHAHTQQQLYLQQQMHYMRQQQQQIHHQQQQHTHSPTTPTQKQTKQQQLHHPSVVPETINLGSSSEDEESSATALHPSPKDDVPKKEESPSKSNSKEEELFGETKKEENKDNEDRLAPPCVEHLSKEIKSPVCSDEPNEEAESISSRIKEEVEKTSLPPPHIQIKAEVLEEEEAEEVVDIKVEDDFHLSPSKHQEDCRDSVVQALLSLGDGCEPPHKETNHDAFDGFDALISVLEESLPSFDAESGLELLLRAVKDDSLSQGFPSFFHDAYTLDVSLLCSVTASDYVSLSNAVDPMVSLRCKHDVHDYTHPEQSAEFIANRVKRAEALKYGEVDKYEGIKSLAAVVKKIKNTEIMSQLEVELRGALVQIQSSYREKQKQLVRLKARSPKKKRRGKTAAASSNKRPPGRPKKRKITLTPPPPSSKQRNKSCGSSDDNDADEEYEEEDLSPPILEPAASSSPESPSHTTSHSSPVSSSACSSSLLKPPKLTAASSSMRQVTNLSTIKARFMRGKENPFANLMKLASTPSSSKPGSTKSGDSEEEDPMMGAHSSDDDDVSSASSSHKAEDLSTFINTIKKRKSDNPQKHCASTETLVTKKPKNLFMMNRLNYPSSFSEGRDEYEFEEEDEEASGGDGCRHETQHKRSISFADYGSPSGFENSPAKNEAMAKSSPSPKAAKTTTSYIHSTKNLNNLRDSDNGLRSAKLSADDLKDGLRLLMLNDGRFWPSRLNSTQLPDVYGVVMEKQRGNRPQILPRDDILQECIMEVKPESKDQIPPGTRVCVYWSSAYNCLFPGTVESNDSMIQVELDDGDTRDVVISNVRMLPYNYSHVFHDPDPIATLRKRRQSSDSAEGRDHSSSAYVSKSSAKSEPEMTPPTKLLGAPSSSSEVKPKKKKKHKKKHKPLRVKLDGTFNNTTTYSIRSPPVYNSRVSNVMEQQQPCRISSMHLQKAEESEEEAEREEEDNFSEEEFEEDEESSSDDNNEDNPPTQMSFFKGKTSSKFNPVTGRPLWTWGDEGYRRPGSKGKAKKLFHRSIQRENEVLSVGDCAVFLSMAQVDRPYIGRIDTFWETWNSVHMMVKVKWFYHPEEIETSEKNDVDLKVPGGLFQSPHMDENDVQTISHKCSVIPFKDFLNSRPSISEKRKKNSHVYYLAGNYEPGTFAVQCLPGVLKS